MAGDVVNIKVGSPLKQLSGLTGNYHAICHYSYNFPLANIKNRQMRQILTILILTVSLTTFGQEYEFDYHKDYEKILGQTNDTSSNLNYDKLLKRFKENDTALTDFEVLALMIGFTMDTNYHAYSDISIEREIYSLNGNGKFEEAKEKGLKFNKTHPLNQMTLIELSYSYCFNPYKPRVFSFIFI